jgi:hypothetical protein
MSLIIYCHELMAPRLIMSCGLDDWIYWQLLVQPVLITINLLPRTRSILVLQQLLNSILRQLPASEVDSFIRILHGKHSPLIAPLPSNRYPAVPCVCFCRNVFSDPLPSNGHDADHIENSSCNIFCIVACAYLGHCLEMGLHVTIYIYFFLPG